MVPEGDRLATAFERGRALGGKARHGRFGQGERCRGVQCLISQHTGTRFLPFAVRPAARRFGIWCIRPSGHKASDLHRRRRAEADRVFVAQHGEAASIERRGDDWAIDLNGRERQP